MLRSLYRIVSQKYSPHHATDIQEIESPENSSRVKSEFTCFWPVGHEIQPIPTVIHLMDGKIAHSSTDMLQVTDTSVWRHLTLGQLCYSSHVFLVVGKQLTEGRDRGGL